MLHDHTLIMPALITITLSPSTRLHNVVDKFSIYLVNKLSIIIKKVNYHLIALE